MNSIYGKLMKNILISLALTNLVFISIVVVAESEFDRSLSAKSQQRFGYLFPQNFVEKKYSEFLGGPGKRAPDYDDIILDKKLSEFLGGPGKKRMSSSRYYPKRLSEFLGGPGK